MTQTQKLVLENVLRATLAGRWYRASSHGERVTLASLFRHGALIRRVWRGEEGTANCAHEYHISLLWRRSLDVAGLSR
jgi:hypothetical protein